MFPSTDRTRDSPDQVCLIRSSDEKSSMLVAHTSEVPRLAVHRVEATHNYTEQEMSTRSDRRIEYWTEAQKSTMDSIAVEVYWPAISFDLSAKD